MTSGSAIRAAVLLPPRDALPALRAEIAALLSAYAAENAEVELLPIDQEGSAADRASIACEFLRREEPLALVASFTDGADAELAAVADELEVPLLATLSSTPRSSVASHRWLRDLCGGVLEQCAALLTIVEGKRIALLHGDDDVARRVPGAQPFHAHETTARDLEGFDAVLFACADAAHLLRELTHDPVLLIAGAALPPSAFDRAQPSVAWVALPSCARDESPFAVAEHRALAGRHGLPAAHRLSHFAALTSLALFRDALRRCAGAVDRASLLRAVDETRDFRSGLLPPLTYSESRHIGSTGAWLVPVHEARAMRMVWVDATPAAAP